MANIDSPRRADFNAVGQLARIAKLLGVELVKVAAQRDDQTPESGAGMFFERTGSRFRIEKNSEGTLLVVRPNFEGKGVASNANGSPASFIISAEFELKYQLAPSDWVNDESLTQFAELNGKYNAWPFWRELVHSTALRLGLVGVLVPLLIVNFPKQAQDKGEQTEGRS
jgi:hypothetical protein